MARDNYSFQKYKREQAKKKKREEKLQRKLDKKNQKSAEILAADPGINISSSAGAETQQGPGGSQAPVSGADN